MRSTVGRQLRKSFEKALREALPQFQRVEGLAIPPGDRVFDWKIRDDFAGYLMLCLHSNDDRFTIDVAWSCKGSFPGHLVGMFPTDIPRSDIRRDEARDGEFRTRIGLLWPPHRDFWWKVSDRPSAGEIPVDQFLEIAMRGDDSSVDEKLIAEKVQDAIERVTELVIPYLVSAATATNP